MPKYKIIRCFMNHDSKEMETDLTLEEAQDHCKDPETSSRKCTSAEGHALTEEFGPWFDSYEEM